MAIAMNPAGQEAAALAVCIMAIVAQVVLIIHHLTKPKTPEKRTKPVTTHPVEFYQDERGEWRWRITAANNKIVGASSEGFVHLHDARANLFVLVASLLNFTLDSATVSEKQSAQPQTQEGT